MDINKMDVDTLKQEYNRMVNDHPFGPDQTPEQHEYTEKLWYYYKTKTNSISGREAKRYKYLDDKYGDEYNNNTKTTKKDGLFVKAPLGFFENTEWLSDNRANFTLYMMLMRHVCREPFKYDFYDIYNRYYMNNKLAAFIGEEELALRFGYKKDKKDGRVQRGAIQRRLRELEADGAFIKETIPNKNPNLSPVNVYVLGEIRGKKEYFYWDRL